MRARALNYTVGEVPITFVDRIFGESKLGEFWGCFGFGGFVLCLFSRVWFLECCGASVVFFRGGVRVRVGSVGVGWRGCRGVWMVVLGVLVEQRLIERDRWRRDRAVCEGRVEFVLVGLNSSTRRISGSTGVNEGRGATTRGVGRE